MTNKGKGPIGIFDSGVGGITVLHEAMKMMPNEHFIYYADAQNVPYGNKKIEVIQTYLMDATLFMAKRDVKAMVLACNTATSAAILELRSKFSFPIIGMEPAIKPAILLDKMGSVLVIATELTLKARKFTDLASNLNAGNSILSIPAGRLVDFAENFQFDGTEVRQYLSSIFKDLDWNSISAIVLGCTHFVYFKNTIRNIIPLHVEILDGNKGTCQQLFRSISANASSPDKHLTCFFSGQEVDQELLMPYLNFLDGIAFGYMKK